MGLAIDVDTTGFELVDDLYLVAIIDEGETKVAQCMIYSEPSEAAGLEVARVADPALLCA